MEKVKRILDRILEGICALLMAFMTIIVAYQVFMRYVLNSPSTFSEDLLTYSFVWMSLLSTALVFGESEHMKLSIFSDRVKGKAKVFLNVITEIIIAVVTVIIFIHGGRDFMMVGVMQTSPTLGISMYWVYMIMPLVGTLILIYCFINIMLQLMKLRETEVEVAE